MFRRLAVLALTLFVAAFSVVACPAGAFACGQGKRMAGCCDDVTMSSGACCCSGASSRANPAAAPSLLERDTVKHLLVPVLGVVSLVALTMPVSGPGVPALGRHGLAPPDTPVRRHTLLLI